MPVLRKPCPGPVGESLLQHLDGVLTANAAGVEEVHCLSSLKRIVRDPHAHLHFRSGE
jgi:hypothetical protein